MQTHIHIAQGPQRSLVKPGRDRINSAGPGLDRQRARLAWWQFRSRTRRRRRSAVLSSSGRTFAVTGWQCRRGICTTSPNRVQVRCCFCSSGRGLRTVESESDSGRGRRWRGTGHIDAVGARVGVGKWEGSVRRFGRYLRYGDRNRSRHRERGRGGDGVGFVRIRCRGRMDELVVISGRQRRTRIPRRRSETGPSSGILGRRVGTALVRSGRRGSGRDGDGEVQPRVRVGRGL